MLAELRESRVTDGMELAADRSPARSRLTLSAAIAAVTLAAVWVAVGAGGASRPVDEPGPAAAIETAVFGFG